MPTCSRQTLVKDHAFLVKPAYYLKSLYGVRGFCVCDISVVQEICTIKLIGGIKIRLKISIFYGEKVVHLADF